ncbi:hypothetical protein ACFL27_11565 [candidate division CSSED10-310 bacterium]|uniref:Uncharacterized protein n=1 Tax=candidate division CSSED10-310 bacterium TaxID=2855610 RepID=A0ABV6YX88_UNCC1
MAPIGKISMIVMSFLLSVILSLLPERIYFKMTQRYNINHISASLALGIILSVSGFFLFFTCYNQHLYSFTEDVILRMPGTVGDKMHAGVLTFISFFFTSGGIISCYLIGQGLSRIVTAIVVQGTFGDPIIVSVIWLYQQGQMLLGSREQKKLEGPSIPDRIQHGGADDAWDYLIISARMKENWSSSVSLKFKDDFYWIIDSYEKIDPASGFLRYFYVLKKMAENEIIRTFVEYD